MRSRTCNLMSTTSLYKMQKVLQTFLVLVICLVIKLPAAAKMYTLASIERRLKQTRFELKF